MSDLKNKDYFPHPANLRNDRRMKRVMKDLPDGIGYAAVVITMERLRCEDSQSYPMADLDLLADEFNISLPVLTTVISNYGFFELQEHENEEVFISPLLNDLMKPYQARIEQAQIAGKISAKKRKIKQEKQLQELSDKDSTQQPLNISTTEEKRIEKNILNLSISNFTEFKKFIQKNYVNKTVCINPPGFTSDVAISVNQLGYLHNNYSKKDLNPEDAKNIWQFLFKNQNTV